MAHTLKQASLATGRNRTTILRAIKAGKLSASKNEVSGDWLIEPAELHRLYPPVDAPPRAHRERAQTRTRDERQLGELQARIDAQERLIEAHERALDDLRRRLDQEADERRRLTMLLTDQRRKEVMPNERPGQLDNTQPPSIATGAQPPKRRRWWWGRKA